jgi:outer membrane lipoprotein-sorting protein
VSGIPEFASLMYRPSWPSRSLSGSVSRVRAEGGRGEVSGLRGDLRVAPGGRYRTDLIDDEGDRTLEVCDGQSVWVVEDGGAGFRVPSATPVPFTDLLNPAWLLAEYALAVTGSCRHADRDGVALVGHERDVLGVRDGSTASATRVDAVMDAELGLLLSYRKSGRSTESAEFTRLIVGDGDSADPGEFRLPDTSAAAGASPAAQSATASVTPSSAATASWPEPVSNELIEQLYQAGLRPRRFSAVLHERADTEAVAAVLRETGRDRGGVLGFAADFAADNLEPVALTAQLDLALPGMYRIEIVSGSVPGPVKMISDGHRHWHVFKDRAVQSLKAVPPAGFGRLVDLAWLLDGFRLTPAGQVTVAGRPASQILAEPDDENGTRGQGVLSRILYAADRIDVVVDAELGIALQLAWSWHGQTLFTTELDNVSEVAATAAFEYQPPPEVRVINSSNPLAAISAKDAAKSAVKAAQLFADIAKRAARRRPGS